MLVWAFSHEKLVFRRALRYRWGSDADVSTNVDVIRREQDVYRRLQPSQDEQCHGIVNCVGFSSDATQLAYMQNGDLRAYFEKNRPSHSLQLSWFRQMARILDYIHSRRVLVADIASRNFLLASDLSLRLCDFSEASILSPDTDMGSAR
ncbi:STYKc [Aspergillus sp. HF37]|nr:STYKc [Aspergillus sp. HF37]